MARKLLYVVMFCLMTFFQARIAVADDYAQCRSRCDQEHSDCLGREPDGTDASQQVSKDAACLQRQTQCNMVCEKLRPPDGETQPETPPPNPDATSDQPPGVEVTPSEQPSMPDRESAPEPPQRGQEYQ